MPDFDASERRWEAQNEEPPDTARWCGSCGGYHEQGEGCPMEADDNDA